MKRLFAVLCTTMLAALSAHAQLFNGNLLPEQNYGTNGATGLPKNTQQIQDSSVNAYTAQTYVGNAGANGGPLSRSSTVTCGPNTIGSMYFQYGAFTGAFPGDPANSAGGMLIRGGFTLNGSWQLAPNHALRWLQYFTETGGEGITTIDGSPLYPNHTQAGYNALLFDGPVDAFANAQVPTAVNFESALVCYDINDPKALHSIGSFLWGYQIDKPNQTILGEYALVFTPPLTATFLTTFNNEFGATGTRDPGWTLDASCADCFVAVPEPASCVLVLLGGGLCLLFRRRDA